jgi:MSHA biogenesis protein MshJ
LRERILVLIACLVVLYQSWDSLVWQPLVDQQDRLVAQKSSINDDILQVQVDLKILTANANRDPDQETKQRIQALQTQLASLNQQIERTSAALVSPAEMAKLLEQLLTSEKGLSLLSLQTLKSMPLLTSDGKETSVTNYQIYRHGFSIEFEGGYLATLKYIEALEALPWQFFWDGIHYEVDEYPKSKVRLNLYTLSLSEGWIGV